MDGVSAAASIAGIVALGTQLSLKLVTLATRVSNASNQIEVIGNEVAVVASILAQIAELTSKDEASAQSNVLSSAARDTVRQSADACLRTFGELKQAATQASRQLRSQKRNASGKIELGWGEKAKWPFLQPRIVELRSNLGEAKQSLMLMLQLSMLAISKKTLDMYAATSLTPATIVPK